MELKYYTTEELKAELKRRCDLAKTEKAKIKRCRMCAHWGEINYFGTPITENTEQGNRRCCKFFKSQARYIYLTHSASQPACEHFLANEELENKNKYKK